ncbi:nucleotide-binding domain-containing protein [Apiospora marii]|uniref:Nucleotide-binding domain-containing protein n=1 Tax=Apiospora marii TaxID=335849 RepID=A0ABR1RZ19_9PEZI
MQTQENLTFWRDLTPFPAPLRTPVDSSPRILIVGGRGDGPGDGLDAAGQGLPRDGPVQGVGLVRVRPASHVADRRGPVGVPASRLRAAHGRHLAAALQALEHGEQPFPPEIVISYHIWDAIAAAAASRNDDRWSIGRAGVRMKHVNFFFPEPVEANPAETAKMLEIMSSGVRGFRRDAAAIMQERRVSPSYGAVDAYEHLAPVIDTDACMQFLTGLVAAKGAQLITRAVRGDLLDQEADLRAEFGADAIVNATGLASAELAGDESCYPIRGGLVRVVNDGRDFPKVDAALTISANAAHSTNEIVFLVPRNDDILLIGGITEPNKHQLDLTLEFPIIQRMRARCEAFLPDLKRARLDPEYPLAQGLRPFRGGNVRVERELRMRRGGAVDKGDDASTANRTSRIIHSYGHGGAGWSLAFGCAGDVALLVEEVLLDLAPRPMKLETAASKPLPTALETARVILDDGPKIMTRL